MFARVCIDHNHFLTFHDIFLTVGFVIRHWDVKIYKLCCLRYTHRKFLILVGVIMDLRGKLNENKARLENRNQISCKILLSVSKIMFNEIQGFYSGNFVLLRVMFREQAGKTEKIQCRLLLKSYSSCTTHSSYRMRELEWINICLFQT